jgi:hypothetical protein
MWEKKHLYGAWIIVNKNYSELWKLQLKEGLKKG